MYRTTHNRDRLVRESVCIQQSLSLALALRARHASTTPDLRKGSENAINETNALCNAAPIDVHVLPSAYPSAMSTHDTLHKHNTHRSQLHAFGIASRPPYRVLRFLLKLEKRS